MNKFLIVLMFMSMALTNIASTSDTTTSNDVKVDAKATVESKCGDVSDSKAVSSTGKKVDPLDSFIDCATKMDYKLVYEKLSGTQKDFLVERCMMFEIQNEMGSGGEAAMSPADIQAYEKMIKAKCTCIKDGKVFTRTGMSGTCSAEKPAEPIRDLFMYAMDKCTEHLDKIDNVCTKGATNGKTETPGAGVWEESCKNDLRYQCYQFLTIPSVFQEPVNPVLNKCNFGDQTKIISQQCRSYCYQHNTCDIGAEGSFDSGAGGLGNGQIDPKFKNRKIGNVYLLRKLGMSSCVKGTSFGIESNGPKVAKNSETGEPEKRVFSLYADQSCYAEIAVQYKDPDCGFRPTCQALAADGNGQNLPQTGTAVVNKRCDGTGTKNMGANDLDGVYCEVKIPDTSAPAVAGLEVLSVLPDDTKLITNVNSIELVKKFGPAKCNPGGNGSAKDYQPKDYRSEERGMGIQVHKGCQADFKVTVNWVRKDCTMAGEKASSDTCCQSLIWDSETKICNSPSYDVPALADTAKMKLTGESCRANFGKDTKDLAAKYMQELGTYDQMFTLLNEKADEYFKTIQADNFNAKFDLAALPKAPDSTYDMIKKAYESFWTFKQSMINSRKAYIDATEFVKSQLNEFSLLIGTTDASKLTPEQKLQLEKNIFAGSIVQKAAAKISIDMMNKLEAAYTQSVVADFDKFQVDMLDVEQKGINIAWLCAHKENCTLKNWLIKNNSADDPAVIDYFMDPVYPITIGPSGGLLPQIGGVSRTLIPGASYKEFETKLSSYGNLNKYFNYEDISTQDVKQPNAKETAALALFRKFSTELPLRKDSLMKGESIEKYLDDENNTESKNHLPYYCKAQEDGFEIRVPVGKALEPMRILQVTELLKAYFQETNRGIVEQAPCLSVDTDFGKSVQVDNTSTKTVGLDGKAIDGEQVYLDRLLTALPSISAESSFGFILTNFGFGTIQKSMDGKGTSLSGGSLGSGGLSGANATKSGAVRFKTLAETRKAKQAASIAKRKSTHKDKLIQKYVNSFSKSFGSILKKRELASLGKDLFGKGSGSGSGSGLGSGLDKNSNNSQSKNGASSNKGSGSGSSDDSGYSSSSRGGSGSGGYGSSGSGSGSGSGGSGAAEGSGALASAQGSANSGAGDHDQGLLQDAIRNKNAKGSEAYKTNENDTIFEIITKTYIRNYDRLDKRKSDK